MIRPGGGRLCRGGWLVLLIPLILANRGWAEKLVLETGDLRVEVQVDPYRLLVLDSSGKELLREVSFSEAPYDRLRTWGSIGYSMNRDVTAGSPPYYGYYWYQGVQGRWSHGTRVLSSTEGDGWLEFELDALDHLYRDIRLLVRIEMLGSKSFRYSARLSRSGVANRMSLSFDTPADERFFGLGERFYHVEQRGRTIPLWVEEGGFGLGGLEPKTAFDPFPHGPAMSNWPVPFLVSSRGWGLYLETDVRSTFELASEKEEVLRVETEEEGLDFVFFYGPKPLDVIEQFTELTGRPKLPARWCFAPRIRASLRGGLPEKVREIGAAVTGLDTALHFIPKGSHLSKLDWLSGETARLEGLGFRVLAYFNPFIEVSYEPVYPEGEANGYFVKKPGGSPYVFRYMDFTVSQVDYTNPAAVAWYQGLIDESIDLGFKGFMYDFAEYTPRDAFFFDGSRGDEMHNPYPVIYQKAAAERLRARLGDDFLFFARSGYTGSQKWVTFAWPGDLDSSWSLHNGLPSAVAAGLSLGLSGFPFYGSEIGGYHQIFNPPPDKELYIRWMEFSAYSPTMFDQNDGYGLDGPDAKVRWQWWSDRETQDLFVRYTREHTQLVPYLYAYAKVATETGAPLMRHLFLAEPNDPEVYSLDTEYLLGDELLVAPVVEQGARKRRLYLPSGVWIDQETRRRYQGPGFLTVAAPLGRIPVFIRSGSIIPKLPPDVVTLVAAEDPNVIDVDARQNDLELYVYPDEAREASFELADETIFTASTGANWFPPMRIESRKHGILIEGDEGSNSWSFDGLELVVRITTADDEIAVYGVQPKIPGVSDLRVTVDGSVQRNYTFRLQVPHKIRMPGSEVPSGPGGLFGALWTVMMAAAAFGGMKQGRRRKQTARQAKV